MCRIVDSIERKTVIKYRCRLTALDHAKKANEDMGEKRFLVVIGE